MEPQTEQMPMEELGRGTDTVLAHLSLGEVVIPRSFLDDPSVMEMLQVLFEQNGADLSQYTVGDPANSINPETGYPEFGFFKKIRKLIKKIAPIAAVAAPIAFPGIGAAIGSGILGAGAAGASTLGSAVLGGGIGALSGGGLKGALTGAAGGALGANIGSLPGSTLSGAQGPTQGSGILGAIGKSTGLSSGNIPSIGGLVGSSGGGSSFSPLSIGANLYGASAQEDALKKQQEQLLAANQQQQANLDSFDPSGITEDPGYKFNLEQGQRGLNAGLAASGSLQSGRALKAASEYNQQYADNAFDSYYQRWLQQTMGKNGLIGAGGDIRANATGARAQNVANSLSNALNVPVGQYGQGMSIDELRRMGLV